MAPSLAHGADRVDLAIPAQIFGHREEAGRYAFVVCAERGGPLPTTTGFALEVTDGLGALASADTVIVPGYHPPVDPSPAVLDALTAATERGARVASVCTGARRAGGRGTARRTRRNDPLA